MPKKNFWGCTITGNDFYDLYDNENFQYFNLKWNPSGKLNIKAFGLYKSIGKLRTTETSRNELEQRFKGQLNLYKEQLEEALKENNVNLITIAPEKSAIGELVALRIKFETEALLTIYATLNPSPPAPPSDAFRL